MKYFVAGVMVLALMLGGCSLASLGTNRINRDTAAVETPSVKRSIIIERRSDGTLVITRDDGGRIVAEEGGRP